MKYLDGICIFILFIILFLCFKISWYNEGFDIVYQRIKSGVIENDIIDSKYMKDEKNYKTEISFYVNDQIPTPTIPPTPKPIVLTCTPKIIKVTQAPSSQNTKDLLAQLQKSGLLDNKSQNMDIQTIIKLLQQMGYIGNGGTGGGGSGGTGGGGGVISKTTAPSSNTSQTATKSTTSLQYFYSFEPDSINSSNKLTNAAINYPDATVNGVKISNTVFILGSGSGYFDNSSTSSTKTLDTNADYIVCPNINSKDYTNGLSIALWMNPIKPSTSNTYYIALCLGKSYEDNIYIGYNNDALYYGINGVDGYMNGVLPSNTWTHVVWTISNSGTHNIYINGKSIGVPDTDTIAYLSNHDYPFVIGYNYAGVSQGLADYFNGYLDDIRIYNRELKGTEAQQLYDKTNIT